MNLEQIERFMSFLPSLKGRTEISVHLLVKEVWVGYLYNDFIRFGWWFSALIVKHFEIDCKTYQYNVYIIYDKVFCLFQVNEVKKLLRPGRDFVTISFQYQSVNSDLLFYVMWREKLINKSNLNMDNQELKITGESRRDSERPR